MTHLSQLLGVRKTVNSSAGKTFVSVVRDSQKVQILNGLARTYEPKDDDGDRLPGEYQKVQFTIQSLNDHLRKVLARQYDVNVAVDVTNQTATGTIEWSGGSIPDVPVTSLMWLEKQLVELAAYLSTLPVLDPSVDWEYDPNTGNFKSEVVRTHRTTKVSKPIVLYQATERHPAQTQLITEDVITGYWNSQRLSGAIPVDTLNGMQERVAELREAVIKAREQANMAPVRDFPIGDTLLGYVFGS